MRALVIALAVGRVAAADDTPGATFEAKAGQAHRLERVEDLVWTLTATCSQGDDTAVRQCKRVREARAAAIAGQTFVVEGEPEAFTTGAWDAAKKSVAVKLAGCVRCGGVAVDGKTWYVAGPGPRVEGGKLHASYVTDTARVFPDEAAAKTWLHSIEKVRVQWIVKVADKPRAVGGKELIPVDIVGYRVFVACNGAIVAASPTSNAAEPDRKSCTSGPPNSSGTPNHPLAAPSKP
jgi:hypothetical protein